MNRWLLCVAVALLAAAGCEGGTTRAATGAVARIAIINDPILNPVIAPDIGSVLVNKVLFPGLVRPDEQLQPAPDLATSWSSSDDGRQVTFLLRPGVTWHDGKPFSARDVQFTFEQILDVGSGSRLRSDFASVDSVEFVDSLTVRFWLETPFAPLLTLLGYNAGILPEHLLRGRPLTDAVAFNRRTPVGTGPFMIGEVQPGATISLVRNPAYYGPRPGLDRLVFRAVPDVNAQVSQLRAGALDLITVEPANLANLDQVAGIRVSQVPVVQHWYVGFNNADPRFASPLVRRALDLAVDRAALISGILRGYGDAPGGTIPVALRDYFDSTAAPLPYAPDSARALLTRAGWRPGPDGKLKDASGRSLAFSLLVDKGNPTREQSALAVQQHLADLGVTVAIQTMEFAALVRDKVLPGDFEAVLIWWTTPPDPDQYAFYGRGQDNNHVRWDNARGDSLLAAGRATLDPVRRRALYEEFQRVEREDPPVLVLFYPREIQAMSARLAGLPALGIRDALRYSERLHVTP